MQRRRGRLFQDTSEKVSVERNDPNTDTYTTRFQDLDVEIKSNTNRDDTEGGAYLQFNNQYIAWITPPIEILPLDRVKRLPLVGGQVLTVKKVEKEQNIQRVFLQDLDEKLG